MGLFHVSHLQSHLMQDGNETRLFLGVGGREILLSFDSFEVSIAVGWLLVLRGILMDLALLF